jgi:hypothetical protein
LESLGYKTEPEQEFPGLVGDVQTPIRSTGSLSDDRQISEEMPWSVRNAFNSLASPIDFSKIEVFELPIRRSRRAYRHSGRA